MDARPRLLAQEPDQQRNYDEYEVKSLEERYFETCDFVVKHYVEYAQNCQDLKSKHEKRNCYCEEPSDEKLGHLRSEVAAEVTVLEKLGVHVHIVVVEQPQRVMVSFVVVCLAVAVFVSQPRNEPNCAHQNEKHDYAENNIQF